MPIFKKEEIRDYEFFVKRSVVYRGGTGMSLYHNLTQEYLYYNKEKKKLIQERNKINAQLEVTEKILIDLNDILCKHGNHIYEHFEESEGINADSN